MRKSAKNEEKITRHHRSINKRQYAPACSETKTKKESNPSGKTETRAEVSAAEKPTEEKEMTPEQIEKERQAFNEWHKRTIRENPEMIEEIEGNSAEQGWLARAEQPAWISVKEWLPENGTEVVILFEGNDDIYTITGRYSKDQDSFFDCGGHEIRDATHWQPLPMRLKENT